MRSDIDGQEWWTINEHDLYEDRTLICGLENKNVNNPRSCEHYLGTSAVLYQLS